MATRPLSTIVLGTAMILPGSVATAYEGGDEPAKGLPAPIAGAFQPPAEFAGDFGPYKSPLIFDDGRPVRDSAEWPGRRREILATWHGIMGPWPAAIERPRI